MKDIAAVSSPVLPAKDVVVLNSSIGNKKRPRVEEFIFHGDGEDYRLGVFLSVLNGFEALNNVAVWEDRSSPNPIMGVAGRVGEIQKLSLLENAHYDIPMYILGWSLSGVTEFRWNQERFIESESYITLIFESKSHPRPLVDSEIPVRIDNALMSVFSYPLVSAPDGNRGDGVDDKNEKAKAFKAKGRPVYPIALSIAGYFGMLAARLSIGRCRKWWTGGLCSLGMISGFCIAVFGGLIGLDRIAGVF